MTFLLCSLVLTPLIGELKPLAEEKQLVESEQVALEFSRLEVSELGMIGWTKTTVQRAQLEGATHYLVVREAELMDLGTPGFTVMESRGLFDADFNLVRELRLKKPLGGDSKPLELEWGDEGFRWREGRGRWDTEAGKVRPTAETDIPLFVHGLSFPTPWTAQVFDTETKQVQPQTLRPAKAKTNDGEEVMVLDVEGPTPMRHSLRKDGVYLESKLDALQIFGVDVEEGTELTMRRALADNPALKKLIDQTLPASWDENKRVYTHSSLGMSLELPKGWRRSPANEVNGVTFHALSEDSNAYVSLSVLVLGTGNTLERWGERLVENKVESAVDGVVKTKNKSFAKQDAISLEYVRAGKAPLVSLDYAWKREGFGFYLSGGTWEESPKKLHKETSSALKSVKFPR